MSFRFRRSISLGKGARINLSKSGIGMSVGIPGARVSIGPRGARGTVGIPGSGLSWSKSLTSGARSNSYRGGGSRRLTKTETVDALCNRTDNIGHVARELRRMMPQVFDMAKIGANQYGWPLEVHMSINEGDAGVFGLKLSVFTPGTDRNTEASDLMYSIASVSQRISQDSVIISLIDNMSEIRQGASRLFLPVVASTGCCLVPALIFLIAAVILFVY